MGAMISISELREFHSVTKSTKHVTLELDDMRFDLFLVPCQFKKNMKSKFFREYKCLFHH